MCNYFTIICFLFLLSDVAAQEGIQTANNLVVEDLVKDVFIKGNCRNVSNITAIGNDSISIGEFENGAAIFNFNDGIILSTGAIDLAQGPNLAIDASYSFDAQGNDPDLSQLATDDLFDVTGIEFDFVPLEDKVTFRYVFASEEYCEFVGTSFNDVFGFFVSGPGINGSFANNAINVATITTLTGTTESVSINNINHLENEIFYISNITTTDAQNCELSYDPLYQELIEYDGFTIPLIASFSVIPCETYRIRLVIGDVGDPILDSAVFLASNSFDLGEQVTIRAEVPGTNEPIAYESCVDGQFVFTRNDLSSLNQNLIVNYTISSDSEAINGVDFEPIPLSITIPAGDTSFILPIAIIDDMIPEGAENLKLELVYDCDCIDPVLTDLIIDETDSLSTNFDSLLVCTNQQFSIVPELTGGVPPFNFLWETGETTESLTTSVTEATSYTLTTTDFCGTTSLGIATVEIQDIPTATLEGNYNLCEIADSGIPILLEGNPPWQIRYTIDGIEQTTFDNIQTTPFFLSAIEEGLYELIAFSDANCQGVVMGNAIVESTFDVETVVIPPSCPNSFDGSIQINQLDAIAPFSLDWNIETEDDFFIENLAEGTYILSVLDGDDCLYEEKFDLAATSNDIKDCLPIYIPNTFSPNNDGINDSFSIFYDSTSGVEKIVSLQVYDRWGTLLFEQKNFTSDNMISWTGAYKGKPLNTGVYIYKIILAFENNETLLLSGDISLLR